MLRPRVIVQRTRVLPPPGMEPTRRQLEDPQKRSQREARTGPIDGAQDPPLGASVGQPLARQRESGAAPQGQHELQERRELLDTSPERQNLVLEFPLAQVAHVEADHALRRPAEPPPGRRARDAEIGRECHVPGAVDEILEPVVIAPLRAGPGRHRDDHRPLAHAVQLSQGETERPPT